MRRLESDILLPECKTMNISFNSAKNYFAEMIEEIRKGKDYVIIMRGKPVAKISPMNENTLSRKEIVERLSAYRSF
jgi:antitoxin (DNA-binding transcriptional repressor) of toxin-antitoxin stability system